MVTSRTPTPTRPDLAPSPIDTSRWVLPVLGVVAVTVVVVGANAGTADLFDGIGPGAASAVLTLTVLAPLAVIAGKGRPRAGRTLIAAAGFVVLSFVVHTLPSVGFFAGLDWNWQGKTFELLWLTVLLVVLRRWAREDVGVRRPEPGSLRPALTLVVCVFAVSAVLVALGAASGDGTAVGDVAGRSLLFDLTHPNLVEELLWRGVLLALLDRAFGTPWRLFGAAVGWGLVLTSLGFGLLHGLLVTGDGLVFAPDQILATGFMGLILGWVRARTGSVWLAYAAHCAPEVGITAGVTVSTVLS